MKLRQSFNKIKSSNNPQEICSLARRALVALEIRESKEDEFYGFKPSLQAIEYFASDGKIQEAHNHACTSLSLIDRYSL